MHRDGFPPPTVRFPFPLVNSLDQVESSLDLTCYLWRLSYSAHLIKLRRLLSTAKKHNTEIWDIFFICKNLGCKNKRVNWGYEV
jgi:hypothetical protein